MSLYSDLDDSKTIFLQDTLVHVYKYKMKGNHVLSHFSPSVFTATTNAATITTFKSALKTHFFSLYDSDSALFDLMCMCVFICVCDSVCMFDFCTSTLTNLLASHHVLCKVLWAF